MTRAATPTRRASAARAATAGRSDGDASDTLIRVAFLVRLIALAVAAVGLVAQGGPWRGVVEFVLLLLTSHLGLQYPTVRRVVARHPLLALPDVALVALAPVMGGPQSLLTLVSVSSALLIGSIFAVRTAVPIVVVLVTAQLAVAANDGSGERLAGVTPAVTIVSVAVIGWTFRRFADDRQRLGQETAVARAAAAAALERLRLARDLHDTVAKTVQGVALTAAALPHWIERDPAAARRHAATIAEGAAEALDAARHLLSSLRLDDPERPLDDVVDELLCRWEAQHGRSVDRDLHPVPDLRPDQRHELVLAGAEALENIARHAPTAGVSVRLQVCPGPAVVLDVRDDGPGFAPEAEAAAVRHGHYGLTGIRERLASAGGSAAISSAAGCGTAVRLLVPVEPPPSPQRGGEAAARVAMAESVRVRSA